MQIEIQHIGVIVTLLTIIFGGIITIIRRIDKNNLISEKQFEKNVAKLDLLDNNVKSMNIHLQSQIEDINENMAAITKMVVSNKGNLHKLELEIAKFRND